MELMFAWFWLIKLAFILAFLGVGFMAIKKGFKNWFWNILTITFALFVIMTPVKMVPKTAQVNNQMDYQIQQRKVELPPMVKDDSFKNKAKSIENDSIMDQEIK